MSAVPEAVTIDVRPLVPSHRHALIFAILDTLADIEAQQSLIINDYNPIGLGMELEMTEQTRGRYDFNSHQREDGAWLAKIERKSG